MRRKVRRAIFFLSAATLFGLLVWGLYNMPPFGHYRGPYGDVIASLVVYERHATNAVSAVTFDYRGFDTLIEESILFVSVVGGVVLLRRWREEEIREKSEEDDRGADTDVQHTSDAIRLVTLAIAGPTILWGLYTILHGHLTPGGGFQGGVILATVPLLVYLAEDFRTFKRITSPTLIELAEAAGILGFVALGMAGYLLTGAFMRNVFPLGQTGNVNSAGFLPLLNLVTSVAVAAGLVLLLHMFLEQTLEYRLKGRK